MAHWCSPLDKGADPTKLLAFCLITEKSQMVVQLAMPGKLSNNLSVPVTGDPPPATLLRFKFHESCHNDTHTQSGGIWTSEVLFVAVCAHWHRTGK